ncbi:ketoacyl-synt-domain-containing protein [Guyanagaster necrorhizus]|uniref:Ketoacyl-synt-domain-containing protein n=1 Tax=Guyanagaster necrorhizus TaxID=856835 RepID=A0A9P7VKU1_9AGAR|nr:ketoacyl-synt-domain-containing protein [Guyanagaster necrorhizus MCA 3950]KAG7441749.1 ketoacyl-synt-domain-containing protein [Guyanagaster necrorhizus MCA 3950]
MVYFPGETIIDVFRRICSSEHANNDALKCGDDQWSYAELDSITQFLSERFEEEYGSHPVVAFIGENHPYLFACLFAVWRIGGIVAPIDHHAPKHMMDAMLRIVNPAVVVVPSNVLAIQTLVKDMHIPLHVFDAEDNIFATYKHRCSQNNKVILTGHSHPSDTCLLVFTSSASDISNLKCVPLTHATVIDRCRSQVSWLKKNFPHQSFDRLRVLGWSPWFHAIGLSHDIGACTILTAGCYIFALMPSGYSAVHQRLIGSRTLAELLLDSVSEEKADIFTGVPWFFEVLRDGWAMETDVTRQVCITNSLRSFKALAAGGASMSADVLEWSRQLDLPLVLAIGMTEFGGPLFHGLPPRTEGENGWDIDDCLISDASLYIDDKDSSEKGTGELWVTSKTIAKGYLHHDSSAFTAGVEGSITFRTGDIYTRTSNNRLVWKGRKEDFIQLDSGEIMDPRIHEKTFDDNPVIARSCIIGNNFLRGASQFLCLIVELMPEATLTRKEAYEQVTKTVGTVNISLPPPLRILWSRILILGPDSSIPLNRKHLVWRKKLESLFWDLVKGLPAPSPAATSSQRSGSWTTEAAKDIVIQSVSIALGLSEDILLAHSDASFAELGMDSAMALMIINSINGRLRLDLPLNACHTYIDLESLTHAVHVKLGLVNDPNITGSQAAHFPRSIDDVVVVGQAMRLPGDINNIDSFWNALVEKRQDLIISIPSDRWDHKGFYTTSKPARPCDITFDKAGFVDYASFDNSFFGISSAEALFVAPSIRLTLEAAFEALENANIPQSRVKGTDMGVFVATGLDEGYQQLLFLDQGYAAYTRYYGTGIANSTACGRISYLLDIHGPSIAVDTACSGSLVALDQAVKYLQFGGGESAIVVGVNTHSWPGTFGFLSAQQMSSTKSRCATFTDEADGYVPSEAVVAVILKTRQAALRDNDNILGVIKSTNTLHNGRSQGMVAPSSSAQSLLQRSLLNKASLKPSDIDFIEAHGTGTSLGDLIEMEGINDVFKDSHTKDRPLIIGAAKSCVGHTETSSGLVGMVKALASLSRRAVPGLTHLTTSNLNPNIDCSLVPIHIPHQPVKLSKGNDLLRALVLAYGFAGTISGALIEKAEPRDDLSLSTPSLEPMLFVVSAKSETALKSYVQKYIDFCASVEKELFKLICYTSCVGREHYRYRFACVASTMDELIEKLEDQLTRCIESRPSNPKVIFGFTGQGSQYAGMARDLAMSFKGFRGLLQEHCDVAFLYCGFSVMDILVGGNSAKDRDINDSEVGQVCTFVYQYSICVWLQSLGVRHQAVIGHSLGEIAAAVIAGIFNYEEGIRFVVQRSHLLRRREQHRGAMAAIATDEGAILQYLSNLGISESVVIAVFNGYDSHVASGETESINKLVSAVKRDGIRAVKLNVDQGFHSPCIVPALSALGETIHELPSRPLQVPMFSTVTGRPIPPQSILSRTYWVDHARNPVLFSQALEELQKDHSINTILDIGPQQTFWGLSQGLVDKVKISVSGKKGTNQEMVLLKGLASLYQTGASLDLAKLYTERPYAYSKTDIPTYPFQRQRYYPAFIPAYDNLGESPSAANVNGKGTGKEILLIHDSLRAVLDGHRIEGHRVLPAAALASFFISLSRNSARSLKSIQFHRPLIVDENIHVEALIDDDGAFTLYQGIAFEEHDKICSGRFAFLPSPYPYKQWPSGISPNEVIDQAKVYSAFRNIHFGKTFRNITRFDVWNDRIDASIVVDPSTRYPEYDYIRKLDPCLHMFGVVNTLLGDAPPTERTEGSFLPSSLEGLIFYTDKFPDSFICRYHLPISMARNHHVMTVQFDVVSNDGELLACCKRYSVAWIPVGTIKQNVEPSSNLAVPSCWFSNTWVHRDAASTSSQLSLPDSVLYISPTPHAPLMKELAQITSELAYAGLANCRRWARIRGTNWDPPSLVFIDADTTTKSIILDVTSFIMDPHSSTFSTCWKEILQLMKTLITGKIHYDNLVVLSSGCTGNGDSFSVGAAVQGMIRVFRRETGLQDTIWGLDVPQSLPSAEIVNLIARELEQRPLRKVKDNMISVRYDADRGQFFELVPGLYHLEGTEQATFEGVTIIVGLGSIGSALASHIAKTGSHTIIFIGRRSRETVVNELSKISSASSRIEYFQADASNKEALCRVMVEILERFGPIYNIVHTAGVVRDAIIPNISEHDFEEVLKPKINGAWNLHVLSLELGLSIDHFVLLSSISVPLGNIGQVAYVAANSYLDYLATYRQRLGLSAVSLQLGAWESNLIRKLDVSKGLVKPLSHTEGIPMIMKAMALAKKCPEPVQVIAKFDVELMGEVPAFKEDRMFASIVGDVGNTPASTMTSEQAEEIFINILRDVLELRNEEYLDLEESLTASGIDSIAFAQIRGRMLKDIGADVPMVYLSDVFSMKDMVTSVCHTFGSVPT